MQKMTLTGSWILHQKNSSKELKAVVPGCVHTDLLANNKIDVQILGIGTNGHIGFNEPGSSADSRTRVVTLDEETRDVNSAQFGGDISKVPKKAITMGIATTKEARHLLVLASGQTKFHILKKLALMEKPDRSIPVSYLLDHPSITFFVDEQAVA